MADYTKRNKYLEERNEARSIARSLLRERDEETLLLTDCQDRVDRYFAKITSLKSQVSKVEAERDALAKQCDELREQVAKFRIALFEISNCPENWDAPPLILHANRALGKA